MSATWKRLARMNTLAGPAAWWVFAYMAYRHGDVGLAAAAIWLAGYGACRHWFHPETTIGPTGPTGSTGASR